MSAPTPAPKCALCHAPGPALVRPEWWGAALCGGCAAAMRRGRAPDSLRLRRLERQNVAAAIYAARMAERAAKLWLRGRGIFY
jgi:hypothetical protein